METLSKLILILICLVFPFGQLLRINFGPSNFPVIDILISLLAVSNIFFSVLYRKKTQNKYFIYFLVWLALVFIINITKYGFHVNNFFYLIRLVSLLSFFIFPLSLKPNILKLLNISIVTNIMFGFIQYFVWPNFTYFDSLNWDPHLFRLVSTYFDPTFTALIYSFFLTYLLFKYNFKANILIVATYIALSLTYSRSALLSLWVLSIYLTIHKKNIKIFIFSSIILISTVLLLPRLSGEGTKLERTSSIFAKVQNYNEAINLWSKSPLFGTGYNNLFQARVGYDQSSHAVSGFDGSLMTILVTSGIVGLFLFVQGIKHEIITSSLTYKSIWVLILTHSLFANSLLYPWTLLYLILLKSRK